MTRAGALLHGVDAGTERRRADASAPSFQPLGVPIIRPTPPITVVVSSQRDRARREGLSRNEDGSLGDGGHVRKAVRAAGGDYRVRAMALWPRLDPQKLRRTRGDAARIARLVQCRTSLPFEMILGMLTRTD